MGAIVFGLFFLLVLGPALWLPSLLRWRIRTQSHRVRGLAALIGEQGARLCYIGLGIFVSLIGMGYIVSGAKSIIRATKSPQLTRVDEGQIEPEQTVEVTPTTRVFSDVDGGAKGLVFSPDGTRLMSVGRTFQLWDLDTGTAKPGLDTSAMESLRLVQALGSSSTFQFVVVAFGNGTIHAERGAVGRINWNAPLECESQIVPFSPASVAISSDGRYALATSMEHHRRLVFAGFCLVDFEQEEVHEITEVDDAVRVFFIGETHQALIARAGGGLAIYDVASRTLVREVEPPNRQRMGECRAVAVSSDGRFSITCCANAGDDNNRLCDLERGVYVDRKSNQGTGRHVVFLSGDRRYAIGQYSSPCVDVYDRATGERTQTLSAEPIEGVTAGIYALAISPDGKTVAATTRDRCLFWEIAAEAP